MYILYVKYICRIQSLLSLLSSLPSLLPPPSTLFGGDPLPHRYLSVRPSPNKNDFGGKKVRRRDLEMDMAAACLCPPLLTSARFNPPLLSTAELLKKKKNINLPRLSLWD